MRGVSVATLFVALCVAHTEAAKCNGITEKQQCLDNKSFIKIRKCNWCTITKTCHAVGSLRTECKWGKGGKCCVSLAKISRCPRSEDTFSPLCYPEILVEHQTLDIRINFTASVTESPYSDFVQDKIMRARNITLNIIKGVSGFGNWNITVDVSLEEMDQAGGTLATGGSTINVYNANGEYSPRRIPVRGVITLDKDDLPTIGEGWEDDKDLIARRRYIGKVLVHEFFHVMGINRWAFKDSGCVDCEISRNYNGTVCPRAQKAYEDMGGTGPILMAPGCSHWDEGGEFRKDIMSPALSKDYSDSTISSMTAAALADLGWLVSMDSKFINHNYKIDKGGLFGRRLLGADPVADAWEVSPNPPQVTEMPDSWWEERTEVMYVDPAVVQDETETFGGGGEEGEALGEGAGTSGEGAGTSGGEGEEGGAESSGEGEGAGTSGEGAGTSGEGNGGGVGTPVPDDMVSAGFVASTSSWLSFKLPALVAGAAALLSL